MIVDALFRALIFVPIVYLVMVVYIAPQHEDAQEIVRAAVPKTGKVLLWTAVLIVGMRVIHWLFLP